MAPRVVATAVVAARLGCGWVLGVGDSKRSGAHTRESALGGGGGREGGW